MKSKLKIIVVALLLMFFYVSIAHAADGGIVGCGGPGEPECTLGDLVLVVITIINYLVSFAGMVAMLFVVWAGWNMAQSGGNEENISAAKTTLKHAIIGFFLVMVAYVLIDAIIVLLTGNGISNYYNFIRKSP